MRHKTSSIWKPTAAALLAAATAFVAWTALDAGEKEVPIDRDDVVGVWVGLTTDYLELIRLDLSPEGNGVLGFLSSDAAPCTLPLTSWSFSRGKIVLQPGIHSNCAADRSFQAVVAGNTLALQVQGDGWKRNALLLKEIPLLNRWEKLKAAMVEITDRDSQP